MQEEQNPQVPVSGEGTTPTPEPSMPEDNQGQGVAPSGPQEVTPGQGTTAGDQGQPGVEAPAEDDQSQGGAV